MAGIKQEVIQLVQSLPETATLEDIMAELYFRMQVDAGLKELDGGAGIAYKEVAMRCMRTTVPFME